MTFPSLKNLQQSLYRVLKRFPFEMLFAFIATLASIAYIELESLNYLKESWCKRVLMTAVLGLVISLATTLFCESRSIKTPQKFIYNLIAALLTALLFFAFDPLVNAADVVRFFLLALAGHLLVAFAAFTKLDAIQGFWQFNKTLFLHFLTSMLYSAALYAGIAAAIGAMNLLFGVDFKHDTFYILWVCITGIFNTVFFLSGVPDDFSKLNQDFSYPKGLKIFTQYVLIPLATLYVVILLAYEIKILIQWRLPKGLVSNLILGYAVFGILSLLLIFPIREKAENKWIKTFARTFYFLMLPLLLLLFIALGTRISLYGFTEPRYFLTLLACWLLFITFYFLLSKKQNIKVIPISLCLLTLLSIYGPQSAFSVSTYSQKTILLRIFKDNHAFENGKFVRINKISKENGEKAVATLEYLVSHNNFEVLQPYVTQNLKTVSDSLSKAKDSYGHLRTSRYEVQDQKMRWIISYFGLKKFSGQRFYFDHADQDEQKHYILNNIKQGITVVNGYDFIIDQTNINYNDANSHYIIDKISIETAVKKPGILQIRLADDIAIFNINELTGDLIKQESKLKPYLQKPDGDNPPQYILPSAFLSFTKNTKNFTITFEIKTIEFSIDKSKKNVELNYTTGIYLIKKKK
ncbi:hypothetical protein AY601_0395 [Pedobacter cryoconitis]|uniref:DUF4153 domain-containing protein n=2 Tax=Pedobacter cryoconitis TaxID=188932 RepID=A0A127V7Y1_9SPHI|nr:hypothetical protein AY601_0395 [Pedobacter cryoconitis]